MNDRFAGIRLEMMTKFYRQLPLSSSMRCGFLYLFCAILFSGCSVKNIKSDDENIELRLLYYGVLSSAGEFTEITSSNLNYGVLQQAATIAVCPTTVIPAHKSVQFGIGFEIIGEMSPGDIQLQAVIDHPELVLADGQVLHQQTWDNTAYYVEPQLHRGGISFVFEQEYELQPGRWVFSINYKKQQISQEFIVQFEFDYSSLSCQLL